MNWNVSRILQQHFMRLAFDQLSITAPCLDILHVKETYSAQIKFREWQFAWQN